MPSAAGGVVDQPVGGVSVDVYNRTDYAGYVMGADVQAFMHVGLWPTNEQILDIVANDVIEGVKGELVRWAR